MDTLTGFETTPEDELAGFAYEQAEARPVISEQGATAEATTLALAKTPLQDDDDAFLSLLEQNVESYKEVAKNAGTLEARRAIAADRQIRRATAANLLVSDPQQEEAMRAGARQVVDLVIQEDLEKSAAAAAERAAVEKLEDLVMRDPLQAKVYAQTILTPNVEAVFRDQATNQMLIENAFSKYGIAKEQQSFLADALDFVIDMAVGLIPGYTGARYQGVVPGVESNWWDVFINQSSGLNREVSALRNMRPEELAELLTPEFMDRFVSSAKAFGYTSNSTLASLADVYINGQSDVWRDISDIGGVADTVLAPGVTTLGRAIRAGTIGTITAMGGRKQAEALTLRAIASRVDSGSEAATRAVGAVDEDVLTASVQTDATNVTGVPSVGLPHATNAAEAFARRDEILAEVRKFDRSVTLTPEEKAKAVQAAIDRVTKRAGRKETLDVKVTPTTLGDSTTVDSVKVSFGKDDGSLYTTEAAAMSAARAMGFSGANIVPFGVAKDASKGYAIVVEAPVAETGFFAKFDQVPTSGWFGRLFGSSDENSNRVLQGQAGQARGIRAGLSSDLLKPLEQKFFAVKAQGRDALREVLELGNYESKWFDDNEFLFNYRRASSWKGATSAQEQEALAAYKAMIDANDAEYLLRNDEVYRQLHNDGYETVTFQTKLGQVLKSNAIVDEDFVKLRDSSSTGEFRVFDVSGNRHYTEKDSLTYDKFQKMKNSGHVLVKLQKAQQMADGTYVQHFVIKKSSLDSAPLNRIQLGYVPGGHRQYDAPFFVKKGVKVTQADTGRAVLLTPKTLRTANSREAGRIWADAMTSALKAVKDDLGVGAVNDIFEAAGSKGFPRAEDFVSDAKAGKYGDFDDAFEVVEDRGLPSIYDSEGNPANYLDETLTRNSSAGMAATHGRMYYGVKGETLRDTNGDLATVIDPFTAMERGLNNVSRMSSLYEYRANAINRWRKTFQGLLEGSDNETKSSLELFLHGKPKDSIRWEDKQKLLAQREAIKRVLRFRSKEEQLVEEKTKNFADFVMGNAVDGVRVKAGRAILDFNDSSPIGMIRSVVFDMTLGMFNVAQLPLQVSTAIAAITMRPKFGMQALIGYPMLRLFRSKGDAQLLNHWMQKGSWKTLGFDSADEFGEFMRYSRDSGLFDLGEAHGLRDNFGRASATSNLGRTLSSGREAGRFFFNEAELINQYTAYGIAWKDVKESFPTLRITSREFKTEVTRRTKDFSFRMMDDSQAAFQRGVASLPTQFWAYPIRMLEAMDGNAFTARQRTQLILGQIVFWGGAGIPGVTTFGNMLFNEDGQTPEIGTSGSLRTRGLIDNILFAATGADVAYGSRVATGVFVDNLVLDILGEGAFGPSTPFDLAGGASLSVLFNVTKSIAYAANWQGAISGNADGLDLTDTGAIEKLARQVSTVNNGMNAYYAYKYGLLVSRSGTQTVGDLDGAQAGFLLFGIQPGDTIAINAAMSYQKRRKEGIADAVKTLNRLGDEWMRDPSKIEENAALAQLWINMQPVEWQDEIRRKHRMAMKSNRVLAEGLEERVQEDQERRNAENGTSE